MARLLTSFWSESAPPPPAFKVRYRITFNEAFKRLEGLPDCIPQIHLDSLNALCLRDSRGLDFVLELQKLEKNTHCTANLLYEVMKRVVVERTKMVLRKEQRPMTDEQLRSTDFLMQRPQVEYDLGEELKNLDEFVKSLRKHLANLTLFVARCDCEVKVLLPLALEMETVKLTAESTTRSECLRVIRCRVVKECMFSLWLETRDQPKRKGGKLRWHLDTSEICRELTTRCAGRKKTEQQFPTDRTQAIKTLRSQTERPEERPVNVARLDSIHAVGAHDAWNLTFFGSFTRWL